jgi:hypothetical protein
MTKVLDLLVFLLRRGDFSADDTAGLREVIKDADQRGLLPKVEEYEAEHLPPPSPALPAASALSRE